MGGIEVDGEVGEGELQVEFFLQGLRLLDEGRVCQVPILGEVDTVTTLYPRAFIVEIDDF
ncbi:hypothetical protein [Pseudomonas boanensis]|uniref:hypothetical protein n=1 Tax=Metapseudomonas boanensis TaxID=2822138 RepID=UPI0035D49646